MNISQFAHGRNQTKHLRRIEKLEETAQERVISATQNVAKKFEQAKSDTERELNKKLEPQEALLRVLERQLQQGDPRYDADRHSAIREQLGRAKKNTTDSLKKQVAQLQIEQQEEIDEIKREKDLEIQRIQSDFKLWSALLPPILPMVVGLLVFARRRLREREGVAKSRLR